MLDGRRVFVGTAAAILCYQLILPWPGLPTTATSLKSSADSTCTQNVYRTYEFIDTVYEFHSERHWVSEFYSTEILLALPALVLNSLFSKRGTFDLRFIGIVHSVPLQAAFW